MFDDEIKLNHITLSLYITKIVANSFVILIITIMMIIITTALAFLTH